MLASFVRPGGTSSWRLTGIGLCWLSDDQTGRIVANHVDAKEIGGWKIEAHDFAGGVAERDRDHERGEQSRGIAL